MIHKKSNGKTERIKAGAIYENFNESIFDIGGAVDYAKAEGYGEIVLIGESFGTMKVANYASQIGGIDKIILVSPVDMLARFRARVGDRFDSLVALAKKNVAAGKPNELITEEFSSIKVATSFVYDSDADIFRLEQNRAARQLNFHGRVAIIQGTADHTISKDWTAEYLEDKFRKTFANAKKFDMKIIPNAEHLFKGNEKQLARAIADIIS
jgi:pimeloyl-ACP methyl ester carboxylesterase